MLTDLEVSTIIRKWSITLWTSYFCVVMTFLNKQNKITRDERMPQQSHTQFIGSILKSSWNQDMV